MNAPCNPGLHFLRDFLNNLYIYSNKVPKCTPLIGMSRTWFGSFHWSEKTRAFKCMEHSVWSTSLVWHIWILQIMTSKMSKDYEQNYPPIAPKEKGGNEFEGSEKNTANGQQWEKLHTQGQKPRDRKGTLVMKQSGRREESGQLEAGPSQGPCSSFAERSRFEPEPSPSPTAVWLWVGFSTSLFLDIYIY